VQNPDIRAIFGKHARTPTEAEIEDEFGETRTYGNPTEDFHRAAWNADAV